MTAPTPNAELAYAVLDQIDAHPETWVQTTWIKKTECGTAGCFAGWAVLLSGIQPAYLTNLSDSTSYVEVGEESARIDRTAEDLLGGRYVDEGDEDYEQDLFDGDNDRETLGRLVAEIFGPRPGAES